MFELMPGDVVSGLAGDQFKTLLGSCVCVILTDPMRTVAAMCHIVHTSTPNDVNATNTAYGCVAMEDLHHRLLRHGVTPRLCEAFVYGGGSMFPQISFNTRNVGLSNAHWVLDTLECDGIRVLDHQVGGNGYRKVAWTVGPINPLVETVFPEQGRNL